MHQESTSLLRPAMMTARLCGIFPSPHVSTAYKVYVFFLGIAHLTSPIELLPELYSMLNDITLFVFIIFIIVGQCLHWTMLLSPFYTKHHFDEFFSTIESAQQTLFLLNIKQAPVPSTKSQIQWILFFSSSVFFNTFYDIFNALGIVRRLPICITACGTLIKFQVMLALVNEKFDLLNWHLDDLNNRWPLFLPRPPDVTFSDYPSVATWRRTKFVNYNRATRQVTADKILAFNQAHFLLCYACRSLNGVFSLIGLFFSFYVGLQVIMTVYFGFGYYSNTPLASRLQILFYGGYYIFSFIIILAFATAVKEKSRRTAILVHDLLDEDGHPPEVIEELEEFSKVLLHRKVNFSGAGYFDLDLKLISRMASLLAPLTLFLVQNNNRPRTGRNKRPK